MGFFSLTEDVIREITYDYFVLARSFRNYFKFLSKLSLFQIKNSKQRHFKLENRLWAFTCMWKAFIYKPCHYFQQWYSFSWKTPSLQGKKKVLRLSPYISFTFEAMFSVVQVFYLSYKFFGFATLNTLTLKSGFETPGPLLTKIIPTVSTVKLENCKDIWSGITS